jgi:hypothetical protein
MVVVVVVVVVVVAAAAAATVHIIWNVITIIMASSIVL